MVISGDTRPSSGSEHLISHAIDDLFPERSTIHGLQVAYGLLLVEERFRKVRYEITQLKAKISVITDLTKRFNIVDLH